MKTTYIYQIAKTNKTNEEKIMDFAKLIIDTVVKTTDDNKVVYSNGEISKSIPLMASGKKLITYKELKKAVALANKILMGKVYKSSVVLALPQLANLEKTTCVNCQWITFDEKKFSEIDLTENTSKKSNSKSTNTNTTTSDTPKNENANVAESDTKTVDLKKQAFEQLAKIELKFIVEYLNNNGYKVSK